jgi:hypothetical protein
VQEVPQATRKVRRVTKPEEKALEKWARELVMKVADAQRLGGGFRIFFDSAVEQIIERVRAGK